MNPDTGEGGNHPQSGTGGREHPQSNRGGRTLAWFGEYGQYQYELITYFKTLRLSTGEKSHSVACVL